MIFLDKAPDMFKLENVGDNMFGNINPDPNKNPLVEEIKRHLEESKEPKNNLDENNSVENNSDEYNSDKYGSHNSVENGGSDRFSFDPF